MRPKDKIMLINKMDLKFGKMLYIQFNKENGADEVFFAIIIKKYWDIFISPNNFFDFGKRHLMCCIAHYFQMIGHLITNQRQGVIKKVCAVCFGMLKFKIDIVFHQIGPQSAILLPPSPIHRLFCATPACKRR